MYSSQAKELFFASHLENLHKMGSQVVIPSLSIKQHKQKTWQSHSEQEMREKMIMEFCQKGSEPEMAFGIGTCYAKLGTLWAGDS